MRQFRDVAVDKVLMGSNPPIRCDVGNIFVHCRHRLTGFTTHDGSNIRLLALRNGAFRVCGHDPWGVSLGMVGLLDGVKRVSPL